jgi:hypothetical protein
LAIGCWVIPIQERRQLQCGCVQSPKHSSQTKSLELLWTRVPAAVENLVGTNSDGSNGPFGTGYLHAKRKTSRSWPPTLPLIEAGDARHRWNCSPTGYSIILRGHRDAFFESNNGVSQMCIRSSEQLHLFADDRARGPDRFGLLLGFRARMHQRSGGGVHR